MPELLYHSRKYSLDENFFDIWSPEMAYIFGFYFADGNLQHMKSYRIRFFSNDLEVLEKIIKIMSCTNPIRKDIIKGVVQNCYRLVIHSKKDF